MSLLRSGVRLLLPLLVLAAGVGSAVLLMKSRRVAKPATHQPRAPLVEVVPLLPRPHAVVVAGQGTVGAARMVTLQPEVAGRLVSVDAACVPGGRVRRGQVLARLDGRDYALAVRQQEAAVARAEFELESERGRKDIAEREWALMHGEGDDADAPGRALALREPHLRAAVAGLEAAKSTLARAHLNVERTVVRAPFDALVVQEWAEVGQVVGPGTRLATLAGTDSYWIDVSLPADRLPLVDIPSVNAEQGARVTVRQRAGDRTTERVGRVLRLLGGVDPQGRMARIVVGVDAPLDGGPLPLLIDSFVDVEIEGRTLQGVFDVPRAALLDGDRVYLADAADRLVVRAVQVA